MRTWFCTIGLVMLCCLALPALAAEKAEDAPAPAAVVKPVYQIRTDRSGSQLNWLTGQLEAVGIGYATERGKMAKQQARATALAIMLQEARRALPGIHIDAATTLAAVMAGNESERLLDAALAQMVPIDERWEPARGRYTVVAVLSLFGQEGITYLGSKGLVAAKAIEVPMEQVNLLTPVPRGHTPQKFSAPYSGVIINADHVMLTPCLFPRVLRFDGKEIWGPSMLKPAAAVSGPVRYCANLQTALNEKLAGDSPLIIEAIGVGMGSYPVLNVDDVLLTLMQHKYHALLDRTPIIVTLGQSGSD
jgi:hypothetical protein